MNETRKKYVILKMLLTHYVLLLNQNRERKKIPPQNPKALKSKYEKIKQKETKTHKKPAAHVNVQ